MEKTDYLVVGGGVAGAQATAAIRAKDPAGRIVLIAGEPHLPYDRPPLSKSLLRGKTTTEDAESKAPEFYPDQRVELRQGSPAKTIDREARTVTLEDGTEIGYERLLLATGARAKPPEFEGHDLDGVLCLRNVEDSLGLRERFRPGARVVVVGTGYIGIEGAAAALDAGASVTLVDPGARAWGKFASETTGGYVRSFLEGKGATFQLGDEVTAVARDGDALRVTLKGGDTLPADVVLVGVGAALNIELGKASGLETDEKHGLVADETLRTADPRVWVAGDIAGFQDVALGKRWHAEHYLNGKWQGLHVGANMARDAAGESPEPYDRVPYFFSDILETHMVLRGDPQGGEPARIVGDLENGEYAEFYAREDGTLACALAISKDGDKADTLGDVFEGLFRARPQVADIMIEV